MAARVHENMSSWQSQCPQGRSADSLFSPSPVRWVCHVGPLLSLSALSLAECSKNALMWACATLPAFDSRTARAPSAASRS
jgi:hypothetical protein